MVGGDVVHLLEENRYHKENTDALLEASKEVGLEINAEKTKCMSMSRPQTTGQTHNIQVANKSFENVAQFTYLGTTLENQNFIHNETKIRLSSGNACYSAVQNVLSFRLLSKTVRIKIYRSIPLVYLLFCADAKPDLSCSAKNTLFFQTHLCLRTGCLGRYLDLRGGLVGRSII
jgi:hypothetical protein